MYRGGRVSARVTRGPLVPARAGEQQFKSAITILPPSPAQPSPAQPSTLQPDAGSLMMLPLLMN